MKRADGAGKQALLSFKRLSNRDRWRAPWLGGARGLGWTLLAGALCFAGAAAASEDFRDIPVVSALVKQVLETERSGVDIPWSNPKTGNRGTVRVERTYYMGPNIPCRDYIRTMERPDKDPLVIRGTGCRMRDARWLLDERSAAKKSLSRGGDPVASVDPAAGGADDAATDPGRDAAAEEERAAPARESGSTGDKPPSKRASAAADAPAPSRPTRKPANIALSYTMPSKSEF